MRTMDSGKSIRLEKVKFPSTAELPAPSLRFLALHAACCRIAVLSGAADFLDRVDVDLDEYRKAPIFTITQNALDSLTRAIKFGHRT
jgi:hypothetical protein